MLYKIIDLIVQEDTFKLFTNRSSSSVFDVLEEQPRIKTAEELRTRVENYFCRILESTSPDSLYFNEASRMLGFVEKIFRELKEMSDMGKDSRIRDPMDDTIDLYLESVGRFVSGLEVPVLQEHVRYIGL